MKRKIFTLCMVVALVAVAAVGGTLAYFQDSDSATNVLVSGNVEILLHEDNGKVVDKSDLDNLPTDVLIDDAYRADLLDQDFHPGVTLEKDGWVENTGSNPAYIRMFVAYPTNSVDVMTVNFDANIANTWTEDTSYTVDIDLTDDNADNAENFTVRVFVLNNPLAAGAVTEDTITSVTMLTTTEAEKNADGKIVYFDGAPAAGETPAKYVSADGDIPVLLHAQAVQTTKFDTANDAFTAAFGAANQNWWAE